VTTSSVDKIGVYLRLAETRQVDAAMGVERATAALREAIGLDAQSSLQVALGQLPESQLTVSREEIISLALARRPEIVQASNAAQVTCLEIEAQGTTHRPNFHTFAAASDIHAKSIPQGISNSEYRPGAVGPEMPTTLVGSRAARMDRARAFYTRAEAVVDKTRILIGLEAEDAYLKWLEASRKVPQTKEAAEKGSKLADDTRKDFGGDQKVKPEDVLTNEVLAAQARAQHNEALYQRALALAALERVTAGGFSGGLTRSTPVAGTAEPANP
jgi:outer membrane protein TolC